MMIPRNLQKKRVMGLRNWVVLRKKAQRRQKASKIRRTIPMKLFQLPHHVLVLLKKELGSVEEESSKKTESEQNKENNTDEAIPVASPRSSIIKKGEEDKLLTETTSKSELRTKTSANPISLTPTTTPTTTATATATTTTATATATTTTATTTATAAATTTTNTTVAVAAQQGLNSNAVSARSLNLARATETPLVSSPPSQRFATKTADSKKLVTKSSQVISTKPAPSVRSTITTRRLETNYSALVSNKDVIKGPTSDQDPSGIFDSVTPFYTPSADDLYFIPLYCKDELGPREKVALEILTTEQSYIDGLQILVNNYLKPLQAKEKKEKDYLDFFINLEEVLDISKEFYATLFERMEHWEENGQDRLGDIFTNYLSIFEQPYCDFGSKYAPALKKRTEAGSTTRKILDAIDDRVYATFGQKFQDYFITPVQRISRYSLLIKNLLRQTPGTHPDYTILEEVGSICENLANTIEEFSRRSESDEEMRKLALRGGGFERLASEPPTALASRMWIKMGDVLVLGVVDRSEDRVKLSKKKHTELILFTDMIVASGLVGKRIPYQNYYQPMQILWIKEYIVEEALKSQLDEEFAHMIFLVGPENEWVIGFNSKADKTQWVDALLGLLNLESLSQASTGKRDGAYTFSAEKGAYDGEWLDGQMDGKGTLTTPNALYDGHWDKKFHVGWGLYRPVEFTSKAKLCGWHWPTLADINTKDEHGLWLSDTLTPGDWDLILTGALFKSESEGKELIQEGKPNQHLIRIKSGKLGVEKLQADGTKKLVAVMGEGEVVGDTAMIKGSLATASIVVNSARAEYEEISVDVLYTILETSPALSMRFYRQVARKLALFLKSLHGPKPTNDDDSEDDDEGTGSASEEKSLKNTNSVSKTSAATATTATANTANTNNAEMAKTMGRTSVMKENETLQSRFHLPASEVMLKMTDCICYKGAVKKAGKLYLFRRHLVFEAQVFGMKQVDNYELWKFKEVKMAKDKLKVKTKSKSLEFSGIENLDTFTQLLSAFVLEAAEDPLKGNSKQQKQQKQLAAVAPKEKYVEMTGEDWDLVMSVAVFRDYKPGETIIEEGIEGPVKLYQINRGRVIITKKTGDQTLTLGSMERGQVMGELSFLEASSTLTATPSASIVADSCGANISIISAHRLYVLFVSYPVLSGHFYSYLATTLSTRLRERQAAIAEEERKKRRRTTRKIGRKTGSSKALMKKPEAK
eukprot:TRINITY_DN5202_c0_g1_i1.p1 TRINITY_DN5202_c0_g1~~TRINITY_DN5202_c0_g1_i1.p1  ORF type:complete len:1213 (+),score=239.05 TRINITY_DN5202_c0_g1_i1:596-4234(+)